VADQNPTGKAIGSRVVYGQPAPSGCPYPFKEKARLGYLSHMGSCPLPLGKWFDTI